MVHVRIAGRVRCAAAVAREVAAATADTATRVLVAAEAAHARGELGHWPTEQPGALRQRTLVVLDRPPSPLDTWGLLVAGADDVLVWDDLAGAVITARLARWAHVEAVLTSEQVRDTLVGTSAALVHALRELVEAALFGTGHVLIVGETGTGKELAARLVHQLSVQPTAGSAEAGDFVVVDCTTIVPTLSGSELFGHEKGAFTGADRARQGAVAQAHRGTLFLDEIGDLPLSLQAELLRAVQEGLYKRVGGSTWARSEFRVVSATHRDLGLAVRDGRFRADLYHRLATTIVRLPPLRERREDILELFGRFYCAASGSTDPPVLDPAVVDVLTRREYEGNLRELRQLATRVATRHTGPGPITAGDVPPGDRPQPGVVRPLGLVGSDDRCDGPGDEEGLPGTAYPGPLDTGDVTSDLASGSREPVAARSADDGLDADLDHVVRRLLGAGLGLPELKALVGDRAVQVALAENGTVKAAAARLGVTPRALQLRRQGSGAADPG